MYSALRASVLALECRGSSDFVRYARTLPGPHESSLPHPIISVACAISSAVVGAASVGLVRYGGLHRVVREHLQSCLRLATTFPARMGVFREATPAEQGKRPTLRTRRCDKTLGRVQSFRTSQHRRRALTELARKAQVTWVARSLRGVRRSMHREPREVDPSRLRVRIAKAPAPALDRQPIPQAHRSSVGRPHGLHRGGRSSTRFAKC